MKKMLMFLGFLVCIVSSSWAGNSSAYYANNTDVDNLFAEATGLVLSSADNNALSTESMFVNTIGSEKKPIVAWALCWVVGGFGIHRHYLGTKGSMWALYTFTCGGIFGIVPIIDWFVLLIDGIINDNIDDYIDNEKFFMWA